MTSHAKLKEASFFIELLAALELRSDTLTNQGTAVEEASFLFSAIFNAFYQCVDAMRDATRTSKSAQSALEAFEARYADLYRRSVMERATVMHKARVVPAGLNNTPAAGPSSPSGARPDPKLSPLKSGRRSTDLRAQDHYQIYIQSGAGMERAVDYFEIHLVALRGLHLEVMGV